MQPQLFQRLLRLRPAALCSNLPPRLHSPIQRLTERSSPLPSKQEACLHLTNHSLPLLPASKQEARLHFTDYGQAPLLCALLACRKRVIVVDTSNEIAGDGDVGRGDGVSGRKRGPCAELPC